jgi:alanyl-tRNA synthetase
MLNIGQTENFSKMDKSQILAKFSSDPERYYKVSLFEEKGFMRKSCTKCKRFFWTLDQTQSFCPEDAENNYSFIGNPPTKKRFDYVQAWKEVESFFVQNGHKSVSRYPVVCRWRDDLYFTIASIVDFQRIMGSKVVFEFPANPLIVPQTCLRFKDIENVGVTGRHFSSFCMIGQHSIPNSQGYWKDECIELDFRLLTEKFGIDKKEVVFVEDVWAGGGSFGSSLEYFVQGLELGNAVFTEFQGDLNNYSILDQKIIDMGAGLERFAWVTMGTPTAYDCCFGPITKNLIEKIGIDIEPKMLQEYFTAISKGLRESMDLTQVRKTAIKQTKIDEAKFNKIISPLEGIYLITDHLRTLVFAISDGALPSNVGGGYNLRMILRRAVATMDRFGWSLDLRELADMHIDYLKSTYPELEETRDDVKTIIGIERERYGESKVRMKSIADTIKSQNKKLTVDDLIRLYESDGITPDFLKETQIISEIPSTFYERLSDLHQSEKVEKREELDLNGIADTDLLYYKEDPNEFEAKVLKVIDKKMVVLDRTSFYPRGGGQEPDHGKIGIFDVIDVNKHGNIIVHELKDGIPKEGETVSCVVDSKRRDGITKHHTSTHILNSSSRNVLGSWVWQHSAFKEEDHARLDITHHSALTEKEVAKIEELANAKVKENIPVTIQNYDRGTAEQKYGFRIYQGGIVPIKSVRIVSIEDFDVEACGGTHVKNTKDIELIKITRTKRIQDGVVRLEFVSGKAAHEYIKKHEEELQKQLQEKAVKEQRDKLREQRKQEARKKIPALLRQVYEPDLIALKDNEIYVFEVKSRKFVYTANDQYDEYFHINFGEKLVKHEPRIVYCGVFEEGGKVRTIIHAGEEASRQNKAGDIAKAISQILGGYGGGNPRFAQGGGPNKSKKDEAINKAKSMVLEIV